ncbi:MAG: AAA family ATPase [Candidatus Aenigmarchaeota archaeon]|nr:AAA family ATPase [Candidatus Aenigmarchaeota archaeon]
MLIIVCGLPGTGKTTIAKALSQRIGATLLRTDVIRKEMLSENTYTEKERDSVYENMLIMADEKLRSGEDCILDGTFYKKSLRAGAKRIAENNKSGFHIVECLLHEDVVKRRITPRKNDESKADFSIFLKLRKTFEPITEKHIVIDTSKDTKDCVDKIMKELKG